MSAACHSHYSLQSYERSFVGFSKYACQLELLLVLVVVFDVCWMLCTKIACCAERLPFSFVFTHSASLLTTMSSGNKKEIHPGTCWCYQQRASCCLSFCLWRVFDSNKNIQQKSCQRIRMDSQLQLLFTWWKCRKVDLWSLWDKALVDSFVYFVIWWG